tara:strand:- start:444 stop:1136 length:693 start_codon:yes stop_codon:yes gene_type:complete
MKILCSICARGGSTTLKNKNIKVLNGKPLIVHTLITAMKTKIFDKIIVSSDSKNILRISKKYADYLIDRPFRLSHDKAPKIPAIKHALLNSEKYFNKKFDIIVDLDATSPLRQASDISGALKKFIKNKNSNLLSVCPANKNPYYNMVELKRKKIKIVKDTKINFYGRQEAPKIFDVNASIYIWKRSSLLNAKNILNHKTGIFIMPKSRSIDIDDKEDFDLVEYYMKKKNK